MLSGALAMEVGNARFSLSARGSAHFDRRRPHSMQNSRDEVLRLARVGTPALCLFTESFARSGKIREAVSSQRCWLGMQNCTDANRAASPASLMCGARLSWAGLGWDEPALAWALSAPYGALHPYRRKALR